MTGRLFYQCGACGSSQVKQSIYYSALDERYVVGTCLVCKRVRALVRSDVAAAVEAQIRAKRVAAATRKAQRGPAPTPTKEA